VFRPVFRNEPRPTPGEDSDQDLHRGRNRAAVAQKPDRRVKVNLTTTTQHDGLFGRVTGTLQLLEPPAQHRIVLDVSCDLHKAMISQAHPHPRDPFASFNELPPSTTRQRLSEDRQEAARSPGPVFRNDP